MQFYAAFSFPVSLKRMKKKETSADLHILYLTNATYLHQSRRKHFNRLNPNSDEIDVSFYSITTCANNQVMRIK